MRPVSESATPIADTALLRLTAFLADKPSFGDMRLVDKNDKVMVGDIRVALQGAKSLAMLHQMLQLSVESDDIGRKVSAVVSDALGDRAMLNALERVGGTLRREALKSGATWRFEHVVADVTPQEDPDLRSVLAMVRQHNDNAVVLQAIAEAELVAD
jgi:hypothetical protein